MRPTYDLISTHTEARRNDRKKGSAIRATPVLEPPAVSLEETWIQPTSIRFDEARAPRVQPHGVWAPLAGAGPLSGCSENPAGRVCAGGAGRAPEEDHRGGLPSPPSGFWVWPPRAATPRGSPCVRGASPRGFGIGVGRGGRRVFVSPRTFRGSRQRRARAPGALRTGTQNGACPPPRLPTRLLLLSSQS